MPDFHHKDRCKNRNAPGRITSYNPALRYFGRSSFAPISPARIFALL